MAENLVKFIVEKIYTPVSVVCKERLINKPIEMDSRQENNLTTKLSPLEFTLIAAELIFLVNVYIIR